MLSVESVATAEIEPIVGKLRREIYPSHGEADGGTADVIGHRIAHHLGCFFAQIHVLVVFVRSPVSGLPSGILMPKLTSTSKPAFCPVVNNPKEKQALGWYMRVVSTTAGLVKKRLTFRQKVEFWACTLITAISKTTDKK